MGQDGAASFVEVGPGKVLQGLIKRILPTAQTLGCDTLEQATGLQS
jgi:[acyl-carrier-protein] S-malonyltransferase